MVGTRSAREAQLGDTMVTFVFSFPLAKSSTKMEMIATRQRAGNTTFFEFKQRAVTEHVSCSSTVCRSTGESYSRACVKGTMTLEGRALFTFCFLHIISLCRECKVCKIWI
jgi:hypothetical protein